MRLRHYLGMGMGVLLLGMSPPGVRAAESFPGETLITYQVQTSTQALSDSFGRKLSQIRTLFASVELLLSHTADEEQVSRTLNRMIEGLPFIRAIIVIEGNGTLTFDSSSQPVVNMDLSDRRYFQRAVRGVPRRLGVGPTVSGRSSGLPFLPVASRVPSPRGDWVVVAVVVPDALIDPAFRCTACSIALLNADGEVLTSAPLGYRPPPYIIAGVEANRGKGPLVLELDMIPSVTDFRYLEGDDFKLIFTRFVF